MAAVEAGLATTECAVKTSYVLIGVFALAALLIWRRPLFRRGTVDSKLQALFWGFAAIGAFVFVPGYLGGLAVAACFAVLICGCLSEFFGMAKLEASSTYKRPALMLGLVTVVAAALIDPSKPLSASLFYLMPALITMVACLLPVFTGRCQGALAAGGATVVATCYIGWFLAHMILMRNLPNGFGLYVFVILVVAFNDIFAYVIGKKLGKHQLCPLVSPGKTWEGLAGGTLGSVLAACLFSYAVPSLGLVTIVVMTALIAVTAPLGDLIISVVKRDLGAKDCGTIMPGHGGLLDRCDSLILAAPVIYYYLTLCAR